MAATRTAPRGNASRPQWEEFVNDAYPDVETDDMTRDDLKMIHALRKDEVDEESTEPSDARNIDGSEADDETATRRKWMADQAPPTLDDVPDELQFSTDTGERRDIEKKAIALDGVPFWLYRPSDSAMYMFGSQLVSPNASTRLNAMMQLANLSLDDSGILYLQDRMTNRDNSFDDGVIGEIIATVLQTWGEEAAADKFVATQKQSKGNRQQRRAADRAKSKGKGKSRR